MKYGGFPIFLREDDSIMGLPTIGQVFFDDTGAHSEESGTFRWIGLAGQAESWDAIQNRWKDILRASPAIYYWHTVSAHHNRLKDMEDKPVSIDRTARVAKETALCKLLGDNHDYIACIEVSVDIAEHNQIVRGKIAPGNKILADNPTYARALESKALVALYHTIKLSSDMIEGVAKSIGRDGPHNPRLMWHVFEDSDAPWQDEVCGAIQMLNLLRRHQQKPKIGPVVFLPGKGTGGGIPLEAADLYAWHVNRDAENRKNGKPPEPDWQHLSKIRRYPKHITAADLHSFVKTFTTWP
jgi:hypothetical protein